MGFFSNDGKLEVVSVFGGTPFAVANADSHRGAPWGKDGIVFTKEVTSGLYRVSLKGGKTAAVTHLDAARNEITHRWPQILPGGKEVLFTASSDNNNFTRADVEAASLVTGQAKVLVENAYFGRYLPTGYLTYISGGTLFAEPFDANNLRLTGPPMPILQNIQSDLSNGSAQLSFSENGTGVYLTGQALASQVRVALVDRKGDATPLVRQPGDYFAPRFSPDGKQLALQVGIGNISVYDLARGTMTPLTFPPGDCVSPVWTPDGKRIACARLSSAGRGTGIAWLASDGAGSVERLTTRAKERQIPFSWSPDGRALAFAQYSLTTGGCCEIWTLPINPSGRPGNPKPFITAQGGVGAPAFSPDGHWLAYSQYVSGVPQIFVVPYPGPGGKWEISVSGGIFPLWSKAAHEIFYVANNTNVSLYAIPYSIQGNSFQPGTPALLFQGDFENRGPMPSYDAAPDGKHFAMFEPVGEKAPPPSPPTVVLNWFTRVARLVASGQK